MPDTTPPPTTHGPFTESELLSEQRLRKQRLGMSFLSYQATLVVVILCWLADLLPLHVIPEFLLLSVLINGGFYLLIHFNINLQLSDPSMTSLQMVTSLLPPIWVMYFLEAAQARTIFLMIAIVPALYGILALRTRQFLAVALCFFILYGGLVAAIWATKPDLILRSFSLEVIQMLAFAIVMGQIAIIGGFISGLRGKLRNRNQELKDAMQRIQELVNIDELTGIFNRRRLIEVLDEESNRYSRSQGSFTVCLLDIDHFKEVNDSYGHQVGDEILKRVAQTVNSSMRQIDCFGRYGGEEFMMILPQTSLAGALIKAERVRECIRDLDLQTKHEGLTISVSIGVSEYREEEDVDATIARADQALYEAKSRGRNCVVDESILPDPAVTFLQRRYKANRGSGK